jgi:hypothetical protein
VPEKRPWKTTVGVTLMPLPGSDTPSAATTVTKRYASAKPATTPSADPMSPTTSPSKRKERLICLGVAPIAASTASSRSRCATMTLKVL